MKQGKQKHLKKNITTNDTKKKVIHNEKCEKTHRAIKILEIILEFQRIKLFLTQNIYTFTLGRGVVNEKLIFTVKKKSAVLFFGFFLLNCLLFILF